MTLAVTALLAATMAVVAPLAQAEPTVGEGISVEIQHTNPKTNAAYAVGDVLNFSYTVRNLSPAVTAIALESSNLVGDEGCRWYQAPLNTDLVCANPQYTVTQTDLEAGSFVPTATWVRHVTANYNSDVAETLVVSGAEVDLSIEPSIHEPAEPRPEGDYDALRGLDPEYVGPIQLATNGQDGFPNYRIPALATANNGDLLASYDGRPTGADSPGPNWILQRRSTDNGKTWGPQTVVAAGKSSAPIHGYSDPSYIVDRETGEIFIFHVYSMNQGFFGSQPGVDPNDRNVAHAALSRSTDNGHTWTTEIITDQITKDNTWVSRFATSGNGIQLRYGDNAGRLIQPYPVRINENGTFVIRAFMAYSDDHGQTWNHGEAFGSSMDENKVVELSDGTVMVNTRDNAGRGFRRVATSTDGGITFSGVVQDPNLQDPTNNASLIRAFPNAAEGSADAKILLFSNADSRSGRVNGTVRMSCDDGQTWPIKRVFEPGGMAYSTLATQADGTIGLFYEPSGGNGGVAYSNFPLSWLSDNCVSLSSVTASIDAGDSQTVDITVTNHGEADQPASVLTAEGAEGITVSGPVDVPAIPAGQSVQVQITVSVSEDAIVGRQLINLTLTGASATSGGAITVRVPPAGGQKITVVPSHVNPKNPGEYQVGDELAFSFYVQNHHSNTVAVVPYSTDLQPFNPPGAGNCRYGALGSAQSYTCTTPKHVVTQADLDRGFFAPKTTWTVHNNNVNGEVLQTLELELPKVQLVETSDPGPTVTETVTSTATATATATETETAPTATATSTTTETETAPTVTSTATETAPTATASATTTVTQTAPTQTATASESVTETAPVVTSTVTSTATVDVTETATVTASPTRPAVKKETVYNTPGFHFVNDRHWHTTCEPYSQTTRCRTDIWASSIQLLDGEYKQVTGWTFNNLTYLPSPRQLWTSNPLGYAANWTDESGRGWYTVCDTAATGANGCRTYAQVHLVVADGKGGFTTKQEYVFNNMVLFS